MNLNCVACVVNFITPPPSPQPFTTGLSGNDDWDQARVDMLIQCAEDIGFGIDFIYKLQDHDEPTLKVRENIQFVLRNKIKHWTIMSPTAEN